MMEDYFGKILTRARKLAEEKYPKAGAYEHAAFANSVAYAVTGASGGFGGPSVREHAAARLCRPHQDFDRAVEILIDPNGPIFGPITELHRRIWVDEYCFNDDPADVVELKKKEVGGEVEAETIVGGIVSITMLDGPWAGRVRHFLGVYPVESQNPDGSLVLGGPVDPAGLFLSMVRHGWTWQAEYSAADQEQVLAWFRAELGARIIRALTAGRPVKFLEQEFQLREGDDILAVVGAVEDAIADSGRLITLASDDENGVVIGAEGYEQ